MFSACSPFLFNLLRIAFSLRPPIAILWCSTAMLVSPTMAQYQHHHGKKMYIHLYHTHRLDLCSCCVTEQYMFSPSTARAQGSGTSLLAAKKLQRNFIGIDASAKYQRIFERRSKEADAEPNMQVDPPFQTPPQQHAVSASAAEATAPTAGSRRGRRRVSSHLRCA